MCSTVLQYINLANSNWRADKWEGLCISAQLRSSNQASLTAGLQSQPVGMTAGNKTNLWDIKESE